jgi:small-conductance mechanosensitive channel
VERGAPGRDAGRIFLMFPPPQAARIRTVRAGAVICQNMRPALRGLLRLLLPAALWLPCAAAAAPQGAARELGWQGILLNIGKLLLAWAVFAGVLWLVKRLLDGAAAFIQRWFASLAERKAAQGLAALMIERVMMLALLLARIGAGVLVLVWLSVLVTYSFSLFPATEGISVSLLAALWTALKDAIEGLVRYLPRGLFVVVVCGMAYYGLQIARIFFRAVERGDLHLRQFHPETAGITYQLVRVAVIVLVLIIVFPYLPGSHTEAFRGVSIFLGVVISLGSSSAVSNMMAGVVLAYMRPFRVGDRVKIADTLGDVVARGLLVTRLRTIKNVEVTIPNAAILGAQILDYSTLAHGRGLILHTSVTIGYDAPWRRVHELLVQAALATPGILREPPPFVLQTSLNDYHVSYEINAYTDRPNDMVQIYSDLHANIQDQFNAAGVEILSPAYHALRDGNETAIPAADRPAQTPPRAFRVRRLDDAEPRG